MKLTDLQSVPRRSLFGPSAGSISPRAMVDMDEALRYTLPEDSSRKRRIEGLQVGGIRALRPEVLIAGYSLKEPDPRTLVMSNPEIARTGQVLGAPLKTGAPAGDGEVDLGGNQSVCLHGVRPFAISDLDASRPAITGPALRQATAALRALVGLRQPATAQAVPANS